MHEGCLTHTPFIQVISCFPRISTMCMTKRSVFATKKKTFQRRFLILRYRSWADSLADSHIKRALSLPLISLLWSTSVFITPFKELHLGASGRVSTSWLSQLWLIKDPLSQQEGTRVPSDPVNVRGSLIPTPSPMHILSALTLTRIEGTPNGCQMLRRGTDVLVVNQVKKCRWSCWNPVL